ncbi:MAG: DUF72 domain-containing protein [Bacteroidales bacterium]|jgi:uncharacterized protein YecE (DUF72 family)|nr:DUF72 domain-containing protein [Bacteroidales bacterium]NCU35817.1 DUF72 domain-containing protein [Candidatus Falkowbacteria bacterium]MDD2633031.1 DUF72 domain-containing protein [Bacteroidales bacterium]MDD3130805.1 DUF72 domain-containing protein [Bacteroidales bacterium]MDD3527484.1 DUF72 domain-containing protein [Bacteroidales bacterium]
MDQFIGCSGFMYKHWIGNFYPPELPQQQWLEYYAARYNTVEINSSFYNLPRAGTLRRWHSRVPEHFRFTLKGSRYITHLKKLYQAEEGIKRFYDLAALLQDKLACVLWQLPPSLHLDVPRLAYFCQLLPRFCCNVIEFRHRSWFTDQVYDLLRRQGITFCILAAPNYLTTPPIRTADEIYIRFHGKYNWYSDWFTDEDLGWWKQQLIATGTTRIYGYFNNDYQGFAPKNAATFARMF